MGEYLPADSQMYGWLRWTVEDRMKLNVSAQAVGQEEACDDAFVDDVESSGIV